MNRFLPVIFALALTALAVGFTLLVARPGIRSIRARGEDVQHKLADVIEEIADRKEAER
jgi:hypothetical protein